jgi:hypothetical protein
VVVQLTSDGVCDYTAVDDPDCSDANITGMDENTYMTSQSYVIDDGQDDGSTTPDSYAFEPVTTIVTTEDYSASETTIASDGQDSGDTLGDTGEETASEQSQEVYGESSTQNESNVVYMENEQVNEPHQEQSGGMVVEEVMETATITPILNIDPNALLNADTAFSTTQRIGSFRRSVNSRAVGHLNSIGALPTIGSTSAEQYQTMSNSGSTINGQLINENMVNDPSRFFAPASPSNPTGIMVADASQTMNSNTFDPNQTGMFGMPNNVDRQALDGMIVQDSPIGVEIEFEEALSTSDLGDLDINDFKQPNLVDNTNWYSDQNSLQQDSIYNNQDFYKQQDIYKGVSWYGNN